MKATILPADGMIARDNDGQPFGNVRPGPVDVLERVDGRCKLAVTAGGVELRPGASSPAPFLWLKDDPEYIRFEDEPAPPPPVPQPGMILTGFHCMSNSGAIEDMLAAGYRFVVTLDRSRDELASWHARYPDALLVARRYFARRPSVEEAFASFGGIVPGVVYVGQNEGDTVGQDVAGIGERAAFDRALAAKVRAAGGVYAAGSFSMGSPDFTDPAIRDAMRAGYAEAYNRGELWFDMHLYTPALDSGFDVWYARRWEWLFTACGFDPSLRHVIATEMGLDTTGVGLQAGFEGNGVQVQAFEAYSGAFLVLNMSGQLAAAAYYQHGGNGDPTWDTFEMQRYLTRAGQVWKNPKGFGVPPVPVEPPPVPPPPPVDEREHVLRLVAEAATRHDVPHDGLLALFIAESGLDPRARRPREAGQDADYWPDVSFGLGQQTVRWAAEYSGGPEYPGAAEVERVGRLYLEPGHAVEVAAAQFAAHYRRYGSILEALARYNSPAGRASEEARRNYRRGLVRAREVLGLRPVWRAYWPTEYRVITQHYLEHPDWPEYRDLVPPGHEGLDLRAYRGSRIFAADSGRVVRVDQDHPAYGISVRIQHDHGFETTYAHLLGTAVGLGAPVVRGQVIGWADATGQVIDDGDHLHLTLKLEGSRVDPWPYLVE